MDFSVAEKDRGMNFCMRVGLLSGEVFSPFGELWLAGSHGGGSITSRMNGSGGSCATAHSQNWGRWRRIRRIVGFASCKPADALVTSFVTEAGPWALATPSVMDMQTPYRI